MNRYALVCVALLVLAGCDNSQSQKAEEAAAKIDGRILAKWEREAKYDLGFTTKNALVYRGGKMFRHWYIVSKTDGVGEARLDEAIERPAKDHNERRFDFDEGERSEYFTLSTAGAVKYFSWEGRQFANLQAAFIDRDAMFIGVNVQERECTPKKLSAGAAEALRLHRQLHGFKDDPDFAVMGFSHAGPHHAWLEAIQALDGRLRRDHDAGIAAMVQLGIPIADITMLGMNYMQEATGRGDADNQRHIENLERTLRASLDLAFCKK